MLVPLTSILVWWGTAWVTSQILHQAYLPTPSSGSDYYPEIQLTLTPSVTAIDTKVDVSDRRTEVVLRSTGSSLTKLEFVFPDTEFARVEASLSQELGIDVQYLKPLMHYSQD